MEREWPSVRGPRRLIPGAPASAMVPDTDSRQYRFREPRPPDGKRFAIFPQAETGRCGRNTACDPAPELVW